jgi:NNP family nitrate/nitrite transporter-like MFS transporter
MKRNDQQMNRLRGNPGRGLTGATIGFFIGFAAVALFGPTAQLMKHGLALSPLMLAFLVATPSLSGSLLRIPFSAWVDTTGGRRPFLILLSLSVMGMAGLTGLIFWSYPDSLSPNLYAVLLFLGVLSGCGIATFSVGASQVAYWHPQHSQGSALGTYAGLGNLAPGIFTFLLPLALNALGLAGSYLVWFLLLILGTALYYFLGLNSPYFQLREQGLAPGHAMEVARQAGQEIFPTGSMKASLSRSARIWKTWALVGIYFTTFGGFVALTAWLPTYWSAYLGLSAIQAGALTGAFSISASVLRVIGGKLADRLGGENTTVLALLFIFAGALLLSFSRSLGLSLAAELLLAAGMGVGNGAVFKLVPQAAPGAVGGVSGWVGGLGAFGGFVIPPVMGAVARSGQAGYAGGFGLFAVLALVSLFFTYLLKRAALQKRVRFEKEPV